MFDSKPARYSIREQLARLNVGESYSRSERLDFDNTTRADLDAVLLTQRNAIQTHIARAKAETLNDYVVESGEWRTRSRDIVITLIVTRVA